MSKNQPHYDATLLSVSKNKLEETVGQAWDYVLGDVSGVGGESHL